MEEPLVSIVVPCYNAMPYIQEMVASIEAQTYKNWELLLINDGSTDGTRDFLDGLGGAPRYRVVHKSNGGVSSARNVGLEMAKGSYIVLSDADDMLTPESVSRRVEYLEENPDVGLVDGTLSVRDAAMEREVARTVPSYRGCLLPRLLKFDDKVWYSNYYMFRRCLLGKVRFKEGMNYAEDFLFLIHLSLAADIVIGYIEYETYWYRRWPNQLTSSFDGLQVGFEELALETGKLAEIGLYDKLFLRYKTSRCMTLDWLAARKPLQAIKGFIRIWLAEWLVDPPGAAKLKERLSNPLT